MIVVVMGTRPEIVKMASVVDSCREIGLEYEIVHAAQHYDWRMSGQFMKELALGKPDRRVDVGSGSQALQTAKAMVNLEEVILRDCPETVVVQGDTNTTLAGALAAAKLHVPVCHVEAGLRSYDLRMPEEHNRRLVDHLSSYLFAPTSHAERILRSERTWGRTFVVGNTVIDACLKFMKVAIKKSKVLGRIRFDKFALATLHRAENVDSLPTLRTLVRVLIGCPAPVVFPVHPRTLHRLRSSSLLARLEDCKNIQLLPPVGYFDMLTLMERCVFIMTDSGGIQEEATAPNIRKFVFVMRRLTDRPESIRTGFAKLVGTEDHEAIIRSIKLLEDRRPTMGNCPYGDGKAGPKIARAIKTELLA